MTVLTIETKARKMRDALSELVSEYIKERKIRAAKQIIMIIAKLDSCPDALSKLYDILRKD